MQSFSLKIVYFSGTFSCHPPCFCQVHRNLNEKTFESCSRFGCERCCSNPQIGMGVGYGMQPQSLSQAQPVSAVPEEGAGRGGFYFRLLPYSARLLADPQEDSGYSCLVPCSAMPPCD